MVLKKVQMYVEKVATRYDPPPKQSSVLGHLPHPPPPPPQHSQKLASMELVKKQYKMARHYHTEFTCKRDI